MIASRSRMISKKICSYQNLWITIIVSLDSGWHWLFSGQLSRSKKVVGLILWPGAFQCGVYIIGMYPLGSRGFWANSNCLFKIRRVQLLRQRENGCLKLLPWVGTVHNDSVIGVGASGVLTSAVTGAQCWTGVGRSQGPEDILLRHPISKISGP